MLSTTRSGSQRCGSAAAAVPRRLLLELTSRGGALPAGIAVDVMPSRPRCFQVKPRPSNPGMSAPSCRRSFHCRFPWPPKHTSHKLSVRHLLPWLACVRSMQHSHQQCRRCHSRSQRLVEAQYRKSHPPQMALCFPQRSNSHGSRPHCGSSNCTSTRSCSKSFSVQVSEYGVHPKSYSDAINSVRCVWSISTRNSGEVDRQLCKLPETEPQDKRTC